MVGVGTLLTLVQLAGSGLQTVLALALRGRNVLLVKFITPDVSVDVIRRTGTDNRVSFESVTSGRGPTGSVTQESPDRYIQLRENRKELVWIGVEYDGPLSFDSLRWWVKFPGGYRVLREQDAEAEELPPLAATTHHDDEGVVINPAESPTYDNVARSPTPDKQFFVIERDLVRWELDRYASGHEVVVPMWVETPERGAGDHPIEVEIDPPGAPVSLNTELHIRLTG